MHGWATDGEIFDHQRLARKRKLGQAEAEFFYIQQVSLSGGIDGDKLAISRDNAVRRVVGEIADDQMRIEALIDGGD
jgi:hypothetical protein